MHAYHVFYTYTKPKPVFCTVEGTHKTRLGKSQSIDQLIIMTHPENTGLRCDMWQDNRDRDPQFWTSCFCYLLPPTVSPFPFAFGTWNSGESCRDRESARNANASRHRRWVSASDRSRSESNEKWMEWNMQRIGEERERAWKKRQTALSLRSTQGTPLHRACVRVWMKDGERGKKQELTGKR
jgi:hypothetical protein